MSDAPQVSILIPCYNAEKYVGQAIQSALDQTYPNKEVIVIDDGSTDESLKVIQSFGERIRWETGPHGGGSAARNRGLAVSKGEWIQFNDADDVLLKDKIAVQMSQAKTHDIILCKGTQINVEGASPGVLGRPYQKDFFRMACLDLLTVCGPLHRKARLLQVGGFRAELPRGQERDLHLRLALHDPRWCYVDQCLFRTRRVQGSVSSDLEKAMDVYRDIYYRCYEELKGTAALNDSRAEALAESMVQGALWYVKTGRFDKAHDYLALARTMHSTGGLKYIKGKRAVLSRLIGPVMAHRLVLAKDQLMRRV